MARRVNNVGLIEPNNTYFNRRHLEKWRRASNGLVNGSNSNKIQLLLNNLRKKPEFNFRNFVLVDQDPYSKGKKMNLRSDNPTPLTYATKTIGFTIFWLAVCGYFWLANETIKNETENNKYTKIKEKKFISRACSSYDSPLST